MRYVSLLLIAFSISALLGGFLSGRAAVPHFPTTSHTPLPEDMLSPQLLRDTVPTDEVAHDEFSRDAAVVLGPAAQDFRDDARLCLVLVDAGRSAALESPFLSLNVPVTFVIDPSGSAASTMYGLALERGDAVYLQVHAPITAQVLRTLRRSFPHIAGIAMRLTPDTPLGDLRALRAENLALFDEYGGDGSAAAHVLAAGVRYAARGLTVDDHAQRSYVAYMLRQAEHLARRRTAVVMARPFPGTLQAFEDLLTRAPRDGVHVVGLSPV